MKYGKRSKNGRRLPEDKSKRDSGYELYQRILNGDSAFAGAATAALNEETGNRNKLKPAEFLAAGKTDRAAGERPRPVAEHEDIEETPDNSAEKEKNEKKCKLHED
jgi:hypothetical protein